MAAKPPKITGPRLSPILLAELTDNPAPDFQRGVRYDGVRYSRAAADGLELSGTDFAECEFQGVSFNDTQLRGSTFRDCILAELYAPVFTAARTTWRDVHIVNPRLGSAEVYESGWQSVRIDGGKLDFLNLRGAKLMDVLITDCIINELDLGSAAVTRVTLKNALTSYHDVATAEEYSWPLSAFVPGVLSSFDLPDCYRALAAKKLRQIDPWGPSAG